ncbi:MAG: DUF429 domain-containing protein [Candidatus Aenigmarchaeota archaeon]|nr:DUF429 domain-containing protein [Candidatus Aenigmarchaeota archaeon]
MKIVGIDLAGKDRNPTGFCLLTKEGSKAKLLHSDNEILYEIEKIKPDIIAIDAPFSFPEDGHFRDSDVQLRKLGYSPLSPSFPGMQPLVKRAMALIRVLQKKYRVIEAFPRAAESILGLERNKTADKDQYDALLCALTGKHYLEGRYESVGKEKIIIPQA